MLANAQAFATIRDSHGRAVSPDVALGVQIASLRAIPVPWEPPLPDIYSAPVEPALVAEAVARRIRSVVPALYWIGLDRLGDDLCRSIRILDSIPRWSGRVDREVLAEVR